MAKESAEGGFREAAGVGVGLVELAANFGGGEADRKLFHARSKIVVIRSKNLEHLILDPPLQAS